MRVEVVIAIASAFDVVVQAFICPDRSCTTVTPVRSSVQQPYRGHNEIVPVGPLIDLRGGKTVRSKKSAGGSKATSKTSSKAGRSSKTSKSSTAKRHKPSIVATIKAFFASLMNPHFVMKLEAKQKINEVHTVHTVGAS